MENSSSSTVYDCIIIGAGAAGLTAAIYLGRAKKSVLCLEATTYGGQIVNTAKIENYPAAPHISGPEFATNSYEQAESFGTEFIFEKVTGLKDSKEYKTIITEDGEYKAKTIIIATGSAERRLGLANEEKLIGKGISYCATCDGNFFKDQDVVVNGGGNTAFWDAIYLSDLCKTITIIHRRDSFRADEHLVELAKKKPNIKFITNATVTKLIEGNDGKLSTIEITKTSGETDTLKTSALFVAIGRIPTTGPFKDLINTDESGHIIAGEDCKTNIEGIFVAGDTRTKSLHQLVTATSDGAVAANAAIDYLNALTD